MARPATTRGGTLDGLARNRRRLWARRKCGQNPHTTVYTAVAAAPTPAVDDPGTGIVAGGAAGAPDDPIRTASPARSRSFSSLGFTVPCSGTLPVASNGGLPFVPYAGPIARYLPGLFQYRRLAQLRNAGWTVVVGDPRCPAWSPSTTTRCWLVRRTRRRRPAAFWPWSSTTSGSPTSWPTATGCWNFSLTWPGRHLETVPPSHAIIAEALQAEPTVVINPAGARRPDLHAETASLTEPVDRPGSDVASASRRYRTCSPHTSPRGVALGTSSGLG